MAAVPACITFVGIERHLTGEGGRIAPRYMKEPRHLGGDGPAPHLEGARGSARGAIATVTVTIAITIPVAITITVAVALPGWRGSLY